MMFLQEECRKGELATAWETTTGDSNDESAPNALCLKVGPAPSHFVRVGVWQSFRLIRPRRRLGHQTSAVTAAMG